jgi:hypothetical protein
MRFSIGDALLAVLMVAGGLLYGMGRRFARR